MTTWQTYWVGQKALIRKGDEVLVLHDPKEGLDFPGGRIDEGEENLEEALAREVREETGLTVSIGDPFVAWHRTFPADHKHAGQKVFLVAYRCEYVSGEIALSEEHNNFKWVNKDNYKEVDDGTQYFEILEKYFSHES